MKFLCVKCDSPMTLLGTKLYEDQGSIAVRYGCPQCKQEIAMLTNRAETQLVTSLGVEIGPKHPQPGAAVPQAAADNAPSAAASKCPFSAMMQNSQTAETPAQMEPGPVMSSSGVRWSSDANERLERVPGVVRQMARMGIEQYAKEKGYQEVTVTVLDEAKAQFGF